MNRSSGHQQWGDAGRQRALWACTSARGGMSTYIATMRETRLWQDWNVKFISTHASGSKWAIPGRFFRAVIEFVTELIIRRPTVVHLHTAAYGSFVRKGSLAYIAKLFGIPVVLHMHGADFDIFYRAAPRPARWMIRSTLEHVDAVIALGNMWAGYIGDIAPRAKLAVIPNGIHPRMRVEHRADDAVSVLFLGEIGDRKGTFTLIEAWAEIHTWVSHLGAKLTIVGDGEVVRARSTVTQLGLDETVKVHGWKTAEEVELLLDRSQILVLPSRDEGQPMAILEAMSRGLCIIASTAGGIPELLADDSGILVNADDSAALAGALRCVILDSDLRSQLGNRAYSRLEDYFDVKVISERIQDLYRSIGCVRPSEREGQTDSKEARRRA